MIGRGNIRPGSDIDSLVRMVLHAFEITRQGVIIVNCEAHPEGGSSQIMTVSKSKLDNRLPRCRDRAQRQYVGGRELCS